MHVRMQMQIQVLFYGDAHRHMLAALQHPSITALLSLQEAALVQQLQQQPMPADSLGVVDDDVEVGGWTPMQCLEAMYRILMCLLPEQREVQEGATPKRYACGHAEMSAEEASHQSGKQPWGDYVCGQAAGVTYNCWVVRHTCTTRSSGLGAVQRIVGLSTGVRPLQPLQHASCALP